MRYPPPHNPYNVYESDEEFEVEGIVGDERATNDDEPGVPLDQRTIYYRVRFKGFSPEHDVLYSEDQLWEEINAGRMTPAILQEYEDAKAAKVQQRTRRRRSSLPRGG